MSSSTPTEKRPPAVGRTATAAKQVLRGYGMATADIRPWPDFLIVGTKRGGTTSMYNYLLQHPDVLAMFPTPRLKSPLYFSQCYDKGDRWYRSHFATEPYRKALHATRGRTIVTGEASPYYLYNPLAAGRIRTSIPDVKIIVMLRDPVRRAYSHYWERVENDVEPLSFREALAAEPERVAGELDRLAANPLYYSSSHDWYTYRDRGLYAPQLERYFDLFPRSQILILGSEPFYKNEQGTFDQITDFLGLSRHQMAVKERYNYLPVPPMDADIEAELIDFYREPNEAVYALTGHDFGWKR